MSNTSVITGSSSSSNTSAGAIVHLSEVTERDSVRSTKKSASKSIRSSRKLNPANGSLNNVEKYQFEIGLENLGNTCFMNSSLQCIIHVYPLMKYVLEGNIESSLNVNSPMKGQLALAFRNLALELFNCTGSSVSPQKFMKMVCAYAPHLLDYQQQDSQEFLRFLLDGMSEDLCRPNPQKESPNKLNAVEKLRKTTESARENNSLQGSNVSSLSNGGKDGESAGNPSPGKLSGPPESSVKGKVGKKPLSTRKAAASGNFDWKDQLVESNPSNWTNVSINEGNSESSSANVSQKSSSANPGESASLSNSNLNRLKKNRSSDKIGITQQIAQMNIEGSTVSSAVASTNPEEKLTLDQQALKSWIAYLKFNDSIITDLFAGLLHSVVECQECHNRSSTFDPFLDISIPIPKGVDSKALLGRRLSKDRRSCTLEDCLGKFIGEEILEGDNMVTCDVCKEKRKSVKRISIYRYPRVLIIHMKRFRFSEVAREKLNTDVNFPLRNFDIEPYLSQDSPYRLEKSNLWKSNDSSAIHTQFRNSKNQFPVPIYDLIGISNHNGGLNGGHYIAHVNTSICLPRYLTPSPPKENDSTSPAPSHGNEITASSMHSNLVSVSSTPSAPMDHQHQHSYSLSHPDSHLIHSQSTAPSNMLSSPLKPQPTPTSPSVASYFNSMIGTLSRIPSLGSSPSTTITPSTSHSHGENHNSTSNTHASSDHHEPSHSHESGAVATSPNANVVGGTASVPVVDCANIESEGHWKCFNDERVTTANASVMGGPSAYVLFYRLRDDSFFL